MKRTIILIVFSLLLLAVFYAVMEENPCEGHRGRIVTKTFYSKWVRDKFNISVYLPEDYDENSSVNYPVLYQLDGNNQGKLTAILASHFRCRGIFKNGFIVVGIGYNYEGWWDKRTRDYTYPRPDTGRKFYIYPGAGGGLRFYHFLREELLPYVDSNFRTDNTTFGRTLIGHSLGGYFALFTLFYDYQDKREPKKLFKNFIAASPTLEYSRDYLLDLETKLILSGLESLPVKLYLSMSNTEETEPLPVFPILLMRFDKWKYPDFHLQTRIFENYKNPETIIPSYKEGLQFLFGQPRRRAYDKGEQ